MTAIGVRGGALRSATPTGISRPTRGAPTIGAARSPPLADPRPQPGRCRAGGGGNRRGGHDVTASVGLVGQPTHGQLRGGPVRAGIAPMSPVSKRCAVPTSPPPWIARSAAAVAARTVLVVSGASRRSSISSDAASWAEPPTSAPSSALSASSAWRPNSSYPSPPPHARVVSRPRGSTSIDLHAPSAPTVRGYPRRVARGPCRGRPGRIGQEMASFSQPRRATGGRSGRSRRACPRPDVEDGRTDGGTRG